MNNKIFKNKIAKGLISLITIIILLLSILATSIYYNNSITANVVRETSQISKSTKIAIKEVNDINSLNQLNEGFYEIRNGFVFYLDTFNSYAPLYIRIANIEYKDGLMVVDSEGNVEFSYKINSLNENVIVDEEKEIIDEEEEVVESNIVGKVVQQQPQAFKIGDRIKDKYFNYKGTVTGFTDDGRPIVKWDSTGIVSGPVPPDTINLIEKPVFHQGKQGTSTDESSAPINVFTPGQPFKFDPSAAKDLGDGLYQISTSDEKIAIYDTKGSSGPVVYMQYKDTQDLMQFYLDSLSYSLDGTPKSSGEISGFDPSIRDKLEILITPQGKPSSEFPSPWYVGLWDTVKDFFGVGEDEAPERNEEIIKVAETKTEIKTISNEAELMELTTFTEKLVPEHREYINKYYGERILVGGLIDDKGNFKGETIDGRPVFIPKDGSAIYYPEFDAQGKLKWIENKIGKISEIPASNLPKDFQEALEAKTTSIVKYTDQLSEITVYGRPGETVYVVDASGEEHDIKIPVSTTQSPPPPAASPASPAPLQNSLVLPSPSAGQTIQLNIIDLTKKKPEEVGKPAAQGLQSTAEGLKIVEQHAVKVKEDEYQIVTVYKDGDKQSVAINKATPEIKYGKITGFKVGETVSTDAANPIVLQDANLKQWTGKLDNVPIANGVRDASKCAFNSLTCIYTDYFKDQSKSTTTITPTEKTTEKFKTAYYYNGKELTNEDYFKLKPEEKNKVIIVQESPTFKLVEETKGEKVYVTRYEYDTIFVDNKPIRVYEAKRVNQNTGQVEEFIYGEGDKQLIIKTPGGIGILDIFKAEYQMEGDQSLLSKASTRLNQLASRQFFAEVERVFTEFQGLSYLPTLFMDQDSLLAWRDNIDRIFATLYLGTEYWSSAICGQYLDGEDEGIAYAETPQGLAQVAAHIEAARSEPIITPTGREFIYKITFNVRNGDYDKDPRAPQEMRINVVLKGERTVALFRQDQTVKRGSSFGRTGRNAIAKSSTAFYNEICMTFDKIPLRWKISNNEICNTIQESSGAAASVSTSTAATTSGGGGGEFNEI